MANYKVLIKPSAAKELEEVPDKDRQRIALSLAAFQCDHSHGRLQVHPQSHEELGEYGEGYHMTLVTVDEGVKSDYLTNRGGRHYQLPCEAFFKKRRDARWQTSKS